MSLSVRALAHVFVPRVLKTRICANGNNFGCRRRIFTPGKPQKLIQREPVEAQFVCQ